MTSSRARRHTKYIGTIDDEAIGSSSDATIRGSVSSNVDLVIPTAVCRDPSVCAVSAASHLRNYFCDLRVNRTAAVAAPAQQRVEKARELGRVRLDYSKSACG